MNNMTRISMVNCKKQKTMGVSSFWLFIFFFLCFDSWSLDEDDEESSGLYKKYYYEIGHIILRVGSIQRSTIFDWSVYFHRKPEEFEFLTVCITKFV